MPETLFPPDLRQHAIVVLDLYRDRGLHIATAESCTGGLIAGCLTEIAGSSDVFDRGMVTYSNQAKSEQLGVPMDLIEHHGAVSEAVVRAMAEGALARSSADVAVAVTGVAGPGGGSAEKPVGLVHFGLAKRDRATRVTRSVFIGDRARVRLETVRSALKLLANAAES